MELADLNIAIIVQARMGSTRLPGKIMLPLNGSPVLEHVLERCAKIAGRDKVICAGVDSPEEEPIKALCESLGIRFFAGDEKDVLSRYYYAAKEVGAEWVMRITSDCPLIDPLVCRGLVAAVINNGADFGITVGWPHGLDCEFFRFSLLKDSHVSCTDALHREHVTLWIKNTNKYKKVSYSQESSPVAVEAARWVIDYKEDYQFLKIIFKEMNISSAEIPTWREVFNFISRNQHIPEINQNRIYDWAKNNNEIYKGSMDSL